MKKVIRLSEHTVASASEMREMINQEDIAEIKYANPRHQLFHSIKIAPFRAYKGPWGSEMLYWNDESAYVKTTQERAVQIRDCISDLLFGDHND